MSDETVDKDLIDPQPMQEAAEEFRRQDFKYEAFISYRHLEPDATVAAKVQQMIETFRVPREFYVSGKRPVFRAFRDRDELSATDLSGSLDDALRNSKFLIVICSRDLPKSVPQEDATPVVHLGNVTIDGADRIIPVLVEGEPYESFPPPLLGLKKEITLENGEKALTDHEILAAELRSPAVLDKSFPGYAQLRQSDPAKVSALAKETVGLLKTEKYRIMAAILGCSYGDLKQRDKERRTRTMLAISSIVAVALLIFGVFMFRAYQKENAARRAAVQSN
ncbi:MAG TPA: TIR domain-containing protein, partial [Bellilinea sp.]|nr:TIR domain-containing protein [Bellilinea sp.]